MVFLRLQGSFGVRNCLVVDNSRVIRRVACRLFEDLNFRAEEAEDPESALEACARHMPDVILLDSTQQSMSRAEFVHKLRKQKRSTWPVILFSTTENKVTNAAEGGGSGANAFLLKPFDLETLKAKLMEVGLL
jgi:two-component system chemotaxis response regulator CheY